MQLEHSFTVPVGIADAWPVLLDIERVAPCMPGAQLDTVDGDDFTGTVKVKLGPINLTYKGKASFVEKDESAHRAVISAHGRDARGNGTASAKVTATLSDLGGETRVDVVTDLDVTGRPAQFGRGVMVDVGNKLIGQFADCLAGKLGSGAEAAAGPETAAPTAAAEEPAPATAPVPSAPAAENAVAEQPPATPPTTAPAVTAPTASGEQARPEAEPIDLLASAGPALAKRLAPLVAVVLLLLLVIRLRKR